MDKNKRIEEEIEKTLSLMDNMEQLEPNPYLYTRIKAELDSSGNAESRKRIKSFSAVKLLPALLALLAIMNFYSIMDFIAKGRNKEVTETRTEYLQELSNDYMLNPSSYYSFITE